MFIMLVVVSPEYSPKMVSAASAAFGFGAGFFIPMNQLGWWYVDMTVDIFCPPNVIGLPSCFECVPYFLELYPQVLYPF